MDRCVRVAYRYHDADVVQLNVSAWNGIFGGSTNLWVAQGELGERAEFLFHSPDPINPIGLIRLLARWDEELIASSSRPDCALVKLRNFVHPKSRVSL